MQALELGGKRIAADTALPGMEDCALSISRMHGGLTVLELNRLRWLAHKSALLLEAIAQWLRPRMTERNVGQMLLAVYALNGIELDVIIVGSDERLAKFRHAVPSDKQIERCVMFHPAARRWGLHANVNRFVSFGKPDLRFEKAHNAAVTIEAHVLGEMKAGNRFADILNKQKQWYAQYGYPEEWKLHFQGGTTGYLVGDASLCLTDARIENNTAFDWFITVNGIQVEELTILTPQGVEVASMGNKWQTIPVETAGGFISVPKMRIME
jgi:Xaa-Pro aminopeptidase